MSRQYNDLMKDWILFKFYQRRNKFLYCPDCDLHLIPNKGESTPYYAFHHYYMNHDNYYSYYFPSPEKVVLEPSNADERPIISSGTYPMPFSPTYSLKVKNQPLEANEAHVVIMKPFLKSSKHTRRKLSRKTKQFNKCLNEFKTNE